MPRLLKTKADSLGGRIRKHRLQQNLSLTALSEQSGVAVGTISELERNLRQPSLPSLMALAKTLGVSLKTLTGA